MKFANLLSLKALFSLGFVTAVIPLIVGLVYAAFAMRDIAAQGRIINAEVFEQTKTIRMVLQKTSDIERKARLFVLFSDPVLRQPYERESYENARVQFKQSLNQLLSMAIENQIALRVNELSEKENLIYQQIIDSTTDKNPNLRVDKAFQALRESANTLSNEFESHIDQQFNQLRRQSQALEEGLLIKGGILLSMSLSIIVVMLIMIAKSTHQLDTAIRRLVTGQLSEPIIINGAADLHEQGEGLEWLRNYLLNLQLTKQQLLKNLADQLLLPLDAIRETKNIFSNQEPYRAENDYPECLNNAHNQLEALSQALLELRESICDPQFHFKQTLNMQNIIESVLNDYQTRLHSKSISLNTLIRSVEMFGNPRQLRGIFERLLINAINYSPKNAEIRILLRDSGAQMDLEIEDEGSNIPFEQQAKIFEPLYRNQFATTEENLNIGLAIIKEFIDNHQGKIDIIDSGKDQAGTRIRVQLPIIRPI